MRLSLKTKVAVFITLIIVAISIISTFLFTTAHSRSKEKGRVVRGTALSYALSNAAEEGLIYENLDLLKKASYIIKAPDVTVAQVYSNIWEALDSYPLDKLKEPPHPAAVAHFKNSSEPLYVKSRDGYDFYSPVFFRASEDAAPAIIGFGRIILSSADIDKEIKEIIAMNIMASAVITLFAIIAINMLIGRLVIKPVLSLHRAAAQFKDGIMPDILPQLHIDEIGELSLEFNRMSHAIKDRSDKLIESEKRIKSLFDRVEHAIFGLDKDGNIIEVNDKFKELFGSAKTFCSLMMSAKKGNECLLRFVKGKVVHAEENLMGKHGEELTALLSIYPEFDDKGNIDGFDGYLIDITEKKRMEERLIRAQKMEAVGTLAGGMAHDFNNLLTAILGYAEIILSMTKEGDPFHKPATIIHDAAKRGADFGKKILLISRKEKMEIKSIDINDIVKNSLELLQRSMPKNIEVIANLKEGIPHTKADASQLQQVIINLAVNARDAMPDGGKLLIETSSVGLENGAASNMRMDKGSFIKLSVSDTGTGIDRLTQRKIFDPFFTTKEVGKGTGLGLYIVHSIISNHGGYINLYSEPLKGTQFNIYLPVTKDTDTEEEPGDTQDIRGSGMLLVIDDEADVRELCRDMLEPLGYTVLLAESGHAGINIFRQMQDKISLVIMDMIMPKMGGAEVFQALKTIKADVKVLLCSGYSQNGFAGIDKLLKRGAIASIQKPFSRHAIASAIKKALSE
ncbi:MAG: response regulator [Nitrospirae bacterium]|nr:MAG: response regulator [Nitrospirota bacterium]